MFVDLQHMSKIVTWGVFFGYSDESIIEFVETFDVPSFNEITGEPANENVAKRYMGSGHLCSTVESQTLTKEEIHYNINQRRYCSVSFPYDDEDGDKLDKELCFLLRNSVKFTHKVNLLVQYITSKCTIKYVSCAIKD